MRNTSVYAEISVTSGCDDGFFLLSRKYGTSYSAKTSFIAFSYAGTEGTITVKSRYRSPDNTFSFISPATRVTSARTFSATNALTLFVSITGSAAACGLNSRSAIAPPSFENPLLYSSLTTSAPVATAARANISGVSLTYAKAFLPPTSIAVTDFAHFISERITRRICSVKPVNPTIYMSAEAISSSASTTAGSSVMAVL